MTIPSSGPVTFTDIQTEFGGTNPIALNTDTSILTAIANDMGYQHVFSRQIEALAKPGDVAIAPISFVSGQPFPFCAGWIPSSIIESSL